ncbi:hypothetical protein ABZP36_014226 [Zizania latifolia]
MRSPARRRVTEAGVPPPFAADCRELLWLASSLPPTLPLGDKGGIFLGTGSLRVAELLLGKVIDFNAKGKTSRVMLSVIFVLEHTHGGLFFTLPKSYLAIIWQDFLFFAWPQTGTKISIPFARTVQCHCKCDSCQTRQFAQASVEKNARELKLYIEELFWGSGKQVLLLGHSKGGVDAAAALSLYWSELKGKVAGLALVQSPYGGTPIASDILREGQIADQETRRIMEFIICKLIKGDMRAMEDLTYGKRRDFISKHKLPVDELPIISFHTEASTAPTMLVTLTRVAQAELLPCFPLPRFLPVSEYAESVLASLKLSVVVPASAAMAVSALLLWLRYGEKSDGLVTRRDAEVPGSVVVRPERKLDHAWMVHSTLRKDRAEADATQMCEALMAMLVEIGRKKCC